MSKQMAKICKKLITIKCHFKHLNIDQPEGVTADDQAADGRIILIWRARDRLQSLNLKCSDETRRDETRQS